MSPEPRDSEVARALAQSEERLRTFVDAAPAGLAMFDRDMRYVFASARYADIYRLDVRDLVGRLNTEVFPDLPARWKDVWRRCLDGAVERAKDDPFPRADGTVDYVDWEMRPWRDANGDIGGVVLLSEVVTERRRAAEALARSEERYRRLFERAPVAMAEVGGADGHIVRANERLATLLGASAFALRGQRLVDLADPADRDALAQDLAAARSHRTARFDREARLSAPSGRMLVVALGLAAGEDGDDVIVTFEDLTRRRATEARARAAEQRWVATIRAAPMAIVVAKVSDGTILDVNPAFERLYGWSRDEIVGRSSLALGMFADPERREEVRRGVAEHGEAHTVGVRVRRKDGDERIVDGHSVALELDGEACLVSAIEDVTARERAAEEIAAREAELRAVFDAAPVGIAYCDQNGDRVSAINQRFAEIMGTSKEALLASDLLAHPDDQPQTREALGRLRRGESTEERYRRRVARAGMRAAWVDVHVVAVAGQPGCFVIAADDVTDRLETEETANLWRTALHGLPLGVALGRVATGAFVEVNPAFEKLTGYSRDELVGRAPREFDFFPDAAEGARASAELRAKGQVSAARMRFRVKSGESRVLAVTSAIVPLGGEPGYLTVFQDVTDLDRAEASVREREHELRTAFQRAPVGMAHALPGATRWLEVNDRLCEILGESREEILARTILDFTHPDERARDAGTAAAFAAGELAEAHFTKRFVRKDGTIVECDVQLVALPNAPGEPRRTVSIITDLTTTEHRLAAAAREAEARWAAMIEASPLAIAITSAADGTVLDANPEFERVSGYARAELLGRSALELGLFVQREQRQEVVDEAVRAGRASTHIPIRTKRGELRTLAVTVARVALGGAPCFVSVARDVTEERAAMDAIHQREVDVVAAFENAPTGLAFALPAEGRYADCNARMCELLGYSKDELCKSGILALTHPDDRAASEAVLRRMTSSDGPGEVTFEKRFVRKDGTVITCEVRVSRVSGNPADPVRTIVGVVDVTERRRAEAEVLASEERYRELLDQIEAPILTVDLSGTFTYANRAVSIFGYEPGELVGMSADVLLPPEDRGSAAGWRAEIVASSVPTARERVILDKAGKRRHIRHRPHPVVRDGRVVGLSSILTDLSAQREVEEQLRAAQRMEAVGRLAGGVAHDFNNLLSVILSFADIARSELPADSPTQECLEEVSQAGQRAAGLTRQLLAFSRKQVLALEPLSLGAVVTGVSTMLRRLIGEDITLEERIPASLPVVTADRGQLEQVLMNLVINARDAMPDGGRIVIGARPIGLDERTAATFQLPAGSFVELSVADDGTGMDEATRARIFEPFFTTKPLGKGTGLGLSTVYGIVKQLGGAVAVESSLGKGTTFRILLSVGVDAAAVDVAVKPRVPTRSARGSECVLVVEDDASVRRVIRRLLSNAGYRVLAYGTPEEALEACRERGHAIDLLLTDVVMPGMNGRVLAERVKEIAPTLRVVYMSGYTDETLGQLDDARGHFLRKPFANDELRKIVRTVLDE